MKDAKVLQRIIWAYYRRYKRDLPWRHTRNPYKILVSEVMLQQTQVARVMSKYPSFLKKFPSFKKLAVASRADVLRAWQGLGYNRRALALKRIAEIVVNDHKGKLPQDPKTLITLPGIGPGTAGSLAAFAFNAPAPFIETNIRRVFIHYFFPRRKKVRDDEIIKLVARTLDEQHPREWYYALMDYGAMLGKREKKNPNQKSAHYRKQSPFRGSGREVRGKILRILTRHNKTTRAALIRAIAGTVSKIDNALAELVREGFVQQRGKMIRIKE